jgi:heme/copper-type cytochrome/quinol oxidase subunit 2
VIGGIAVAVGLVVALWLKQFTLGLCIAGAGIVMVAVTTLFATYPWVSLVILGIVAALAAWFVYGLRKTAAAQATAQATQAATDAELAAHKATLGTIVPAIEAAPVEVQKMVKASIKQTGEEQGTYDTVKQLVTKTKLEAAA